MASSNTKPSYIPTPFANQGQKNTIPVADQGNYLASWSLGFPPVTSEPLSEGGLPPTRLDVNGALNVLSAFVYYLQLGGFFTFDPDLASYIGGYPNGMMLWYNDGTNVYPLVSTKNNNTDNFISNPAYIGTSWVRPLPSLGLDNTWTGSNTFSGSVSLNGTLRGSNSVKETITGWGMPDFDSGVSFTSSFVVPSNGFIWLWMRSNDAGTRSARINGIDVYTYVHSGSYSTSDNIWIPVSVGDVYSETAGLSHRVFFPCKGV